MSSDFTRLALTSIGALVFVVAAGFAKDRLQRAPTCQPIRSQQRSVPRSR